MSTFYTAYFLKTTEPKETLKEHFQRIHAIPGSEWWVCDWDTDYIDDLFEPGAYFTKELSAQFGEVIFVCEDERDDQMEYEHSQDGCVLRKLTWISDGSESTWGWIEGEREAWEDAVLFSDANFARASEMLKYDDQLNYVAEEEFRARVNELQTIWDERRYVVGGRWPLGDGTIPGAVLQHLGLSLPPL
jgi:hypothetical protein